MSIIQHRRPAECSGGMTRRTFGSTKTRPSSCVLAAQSRFGQLRIRLGARFALLRRNGLLRAKTADRASPRRSAVSATGMLRSATRPLPGCGQRAPSAEPIWRRRHREGCPVKRLRRGSRPSPAPRPVSHCAGPFVRASGKPRAIQILVGNPAYTGHRMPLPVRRLSRRSYSTPSRHNANAWPGRSPKCGY